MKHSFKNILFSILTLMALSVSALGTVPVYADAPSATEAVSKSGVAGTVPSNGIGTQTIDWTIDYDLNSSTPLTNMLLTDSWSVGQTLVPGSVHTPGSTWGYNQPDSTSINFTNALVAPNGQGAGFALPIPLTGPVSFSGGGDGFNPAITASGKILGFNHHTNNAGIWCYDMAASAVCPGYETKIFPGINSSSDPTVRAIGNRIYIPIADAGTGAVSVAGNIYCWDTDTNATCGTSAHMDGFDRLEVVHSKLYTLLTTGAVDCFDPTAALAECAGYPVDIAVPANSNGNTLVHVGNNIYAVNGQGMLNCLNTVTLDYCSGWSATPITGPSSYSLLFPHTNITGTTVTGICQSSAGTDATCYDLDGSNAVTVTGIGTATTGVYLNATYNDSTTLGAKVFFAGYSNNVGCWDWATGAVCAGSGYDVNGRVITNLGNPYGLTHDAGCIYSFGDAGALFSVDPDTGETPCTRSTGTVDVNIDDFYNAAPGSVSATWDKVLLTDVDLNPGSEFNSLMMTVINPADDSVVFGPTEMIGGSGSIDISSASPTIRTLQLQVVGEPVGTTAWVDSISPKIWLAFASSTPVQFTYQTTITCSGSQQNATNTINTTLDVHSDAATVNSLCVTNNAPSVTGGTTQTFTIDEDTTLNQTLVATDSDNDTLTWAPGSTLPVYGSLTIDSAGNFTYKPKLNYYGPDSFTVTVTDGLSTPIVVTVNVTVSPVEDANLEASAFWMRYNSWRNKEVAGYFGGGYIASEKGKFTLPIVAGTAGITFTTEKGPDMGRFTLDFQTSTGVSLGTRTFDLYSATLIPDVPLVVTFPTGTRKFIFEVLGTSNVSSTGTWVRLDAYQLTGGVKTDASLDLVQWYKDNHAGSGQYRWTDRLSGFQITFIGQRLTWTTYRGPDAGKVEVWVDGALFKTVDLYNPTAQWDYQVDLGPFTYGSHSFNFQIVAKNPLSTNNKVIVDAMDKE